MIPFAVHRSPKHSAKSAFYLPEIIFFEGLTYPAYVRIMTDKESTTMYEITCDLGTLKGNQEQATNLLNNLLTGFESNRLKRESKVRTTLLDVAAFGLIITFETNYIGNVTVAHIPTIHNTNSIDIPSSVTLRSRQLQP
jgi:hypothetical protein